MISRRHERDLAQSNEQGQGSSEHCQVELRAWAWGQSSSESSDSQSASIQKYIDCADCSSLIHNRPV